MDQEKFKNLKVGQRVEYISRRGYVNDVIKHVEGAPGDVYAFTTNEGNRMKIIDDIENLEVVTG